jgi:histidinol-phosphatase (PHP family)
LAKRDLKEIYREYFDEVENSVESRLFNVVGHLDVVRKYSVNRVNHQANSEYWKKLEAVLEEIRDSRMFLEINSKPYALKPRWLGVSPNKKAIKRYLDCGGKRISIGSDAHSKEELGNGVKQTFNFLVRNSQTSIDLPFWREQATY